MGYKEPRYKMSGRKLALRTMLVEDQEFKKHMAKVSRKVEREIRLKNLTTLPYTSILEWFVITVFLVIVGMAILGIRL